MGGLPGCSELLGRAFPFTGKFSKKRTACYTSRPFYCQVSFIRIFTNLLLPQERECLQGEPWLGAHRCGIAICGFLSAANAPLPRNGLASSAAGGALPVSPCILIKPAAGGRFAQQIERAPKGNRASNGCPVPFCFVLTKKMHPLRSPRCIRPQTSTAFAV